MEGGVRKWEVGKARLAMQNLPLPQSPFHSPRGEGMGLPAVSGDQRSTARGACSRPAEHLMYVKACLFDNKSRDA